MVQGTFGCNTALIYEGLLPGISPICLVPLPRFNMLFPLYAVSWGKSSNLICQLAKQWSRLGYLRKTRGNGAVNFSLVLRTRKSQDLWQSKWATDRCNYKAGHLVKMINRCFKCMYREIFNCDRCLRICTRCLFRKSMTSSIPEHSYWLAFVQTSCCLGPSNAACSSEGIEMLLINLKKCIQVFKQWNKRQSKAHMHLTITPPTVNAVTFCSTEMVFLLVQ